jgi:hypothetical protein
MYSVRPSSFVAGHWPFSDLRRRSGRAARLERPRRRAADCAPGRGVGAVLSSGPGCSGIELHRAG